MPRRGCWDGRPWQVEFQPQLPGGGPSPGGPAGWNRRWRTSRRRSAGRAPRCFQTFGGVLTAQAHQAQTGAIAHFRMRLSARIWRNNCAVWGPPRRPNSANAKASTPDTAGAPAVFGNGRGLIGQKASCMARHPQSVIKDLHSGGSMPNVYLLVPPVGRERYRNAPRRAHESRVRPSACATGRSHNARLEEGAARVYRTPRTGWRAR